MVVKNSDTPPQRVIGNSEGEGFLKRKIFKENYARKLEFEDGWGVETKKTVRGRSVDIFWKNRIDILD